MVGLGGMMGGDCNGEKQDGARRNGNDPAASNGDASFIVGGGLSRNLNDSFLDQR